MADDDIDVEGDFNFKLEADGGLYDANELPSKSANLLPEFTSPPWMLEQGWSLDNGMDEKSKATIEKMLLEEQQYINGRKKGKYLGINKSVLLIKTPSPQKDQETATKRQWTEEEKLLFSKGMEKYGHSWSKISKLIPSRTTLQVKNYAQQYLKNLAKKNEQKQQATSAAAATISTVSTTTAAFSPINSVAAMSTAVPTITTRPSSRPSPSRPRAKPMKHRSSPQKPAQKQSVIIGGKSLLDRAHLSATFSSLNGMLSGSSSAAGRDSVNGVETPQDTAPDEMQSSGEEIVTKIITIKDKSSDSESEEIDVDIENDDEGENAILQSRSASPSSVYNKLLEQAIVEEHATVSTPTKEEEMSEKVITDTEDASNTLVDSEDCMTPPSDKVLSSPGISERAEAVWEDGGRLEDEEHHEVKHIVNGVISSTGEVFEFAIPIEEAVLQPDSITEEEKTVHSEFFDGRPQKTAERYLKIRNYILDCWKKSQPRYLNKTCVRPGLRNCGDVNCIGRIHAYLECVGAINFGCEQAAYNSPGRGMITMSKSKHCSRLQQPDPHTTKLDTMRPRKRRIRDANGLWVDEKELEGKTIEHKPEEKGAGRAKGCKSSKVIYDPFKLVPCQPFTLDKQAPFKLEVLSTALAVMDIHAHISRTEVIGMLGGQYDEQAARLVITLAIPCKSISTGMQCEMDPVSQTHASEQIADVGMQVVGWYHSHPTFAPNPSVRDIETQQKFQHWFSKDGSQFVGLIISPYGPQNSGIVSDIQCLTIGDDLASEYLCNTPYQFSYEVTYRDNMREILGPASELAEKYSTYSNRVALSCVYKPSLGITCLSKMLQSVKHRLEPPDLQQHTVSSSRRKLEDVLHWLEQIFVDKFSVQSPSSATDVGLAPAIPAVPPSDEYVQV